VSRSASLDHRLVRFLEDHKNTLTRLIEAD
jgi:hypothetical protein